MVTCLDVSRCVRLGWLCPVYPLVMMDGEVTGEGRGYTLGGVSVARLVIADRRLLLFVDA